MRKTKTDKEAPIRKWERSGLSQADYCRKNGIPSGAFRGWLAVWIRKQEGEKSTEFGFVEIKTDMISEETAHSQTSEGIVIWLKAGKTIGIPVSTQSHVIELVLSADSHASEQNIAMYFPSSVPVELVTSIYLNGGRMCFKEQTTIPFQNQGTTAAR